MTPPSTPAREGGRAGGNAGVRLATPARRTSPTAHREDHLAIGIGHEGKRVVAQGGEIPLDRPKARRFEIEQHRTVGAWEPVPGMRASVQRPARCPEPRKPCLQFARYPSRNRRSAGSNAGERCRSSSPTASSSSSMKNGSSPSKPLIKLHVAGHLVAHACHLTLRLPATWPWPPPWPERSYGCGPYDQPPADRATSPSSPPRRPQHAAAASAL